MTRPIDIAEVCAGLADHIERLARELLPAGHREGSEWVEASTAQGGRGDALKVSLRRERAGVWSHFAGGEAGDALDLIAYIKFDGDKSRALRWALDWLGVDNGQRSASANPASADRRPPPRAAAAQVTAELERRRAHAFAIWLDGERALKDTPASVYLESRGIDLANLGRQPACLRFHPSLKHWDAASQRESHWPAILAAIHGSEGNVCAVHCTWLAADGSDKAPLAKARKVQGPYRGGAMRLWRGASGKPLAKADAGETVALCEGIEDGLTVALARPDLRVLAAISVSNMANIALPPAISSVIIMADNDPARRPDGTKHPAAAALEAAILRFQTEGRAVSICRSDVGKDLNDLLMSGGG